MPEISDEQYARFVKYQAGYGQLKTQYKSLRAQFGELQTSHSEVTGALEQLDVEAAQLREKAGTPPDPDARVAKLTEELRSIKHRQAFERLAKGKVRDDGVEDLYQLSGFKPDADEPDEAALGQLIADQVAKRPLFAAPTPTEPAAPLKPGSPVKAAPTGPITPAEGSARGAGQSPAPDTKTRVDAAYASTGRKSDVPGRI